MEKSRRDRFITLWKKYFGDADLPIAVFYSDESAPEGLTTTKGGQCIVELLPLVRRGKTLCLSSESRICGGARRYLGFSTGAVMPNFEYFLSYGIPGKLKGERYKKSPELVKEVMKLAPAFKAPSRFIVFKRWDLLERSDNPEVVIFFARPDVLAGLF